MDPTSETVDAAKQALRAAMRRQLRTVTPAARREWSLAAAEHLLALPEARLARHWLIFASLPEEIDTEPLRGALEGSGRRVALPRIVPDGPGLPGRLEAYWVRAGESLESGPFGLSQPAALEERRVRRGELDAVVVPGLAFDAEGRRLGRGKGYYDRYLAEADGQGTWVAGFFLGLQRVDAVPWAGHDRRLSTIVTEEGCLRCPS